MNHKHAMKVELDGLIELVSVETAALKQLNFSTEPFGETFQKLKCLFYRTDYFNYTISFKQD